MTTVREIMTKEVKVCAPSDTVEQAAKIMQEVNCGAVPICEGKKVVGMITDRDIVLNVVAKAKDAAAVRCHDAMTSDVTTCSPDMDVNECVTTMSEHKIRRIPVVENGNLVGICAIGDLATVNIHVNEAGEALSQISEHLQ